MRLDRGMDEIAGSLITAFDYVWDRLTGRLSGLTDEEYFWEPVAGCWSLRHRPTPARSPDFSTSTTGPGARD